MKEYFKSLLDTYTERIKNPMLGSLTVSFVLFNWRPLFILIFSNKEIEDKIIIIDEEYCTYGAILIPVIISLIYILLLPYINWIIDIVLSKSKKQRHKQKLDIIQNNMEIRKKQAKNDREIADLKAGTSEINNLEARISALSEENNSKSQEITKLIENNNRETRDLQENIQNKSIRISNLESRTNEFESIVNEFKFIHGMLLEDIYDENTDNFIINFLSNNLNKTELSELENTISISIKKFRPEYFLLLIKLNLVFKNLDGVSYRLTERGLQFKNSIIPY